MSSTQPPNRGRRFLLWSFGIIVILALILGFTVSRILRIDGDATQLRDDFVQSVDAPVHSRVQINLGPVALAPVRLLSRFIEDIPPEARLALSAARRASIGIYNINSADGVSDPNILFDSATRKMDTRDWSLAVAVRDGDESVMVYLPREWSLNDAVKVCVAVCDGRQLILVSAQLRMEPLMKLAEMNLPANLFGG